MPKNIINFAHSNGFPANTYNKMLQQLESKDNKVIYKEMYAHDPKYPVGCNWVKVADELIEYIESQTNEPVIGVGHSFGGTITLNAAFKKPELFKAIILLDPVILNGLQSFFIPILNVLNLSQYITPGNKTKERKQQWTSKTDAKSYFQNKKFFQSFDKECLDAYVEHGLVPSENGGVQLKFQVEQEVAIFCNMPHHFDKHAGKLKNLPGLIISGSKTDVSKPDIMKRLVKQQKFEHKILEGGHMFPLENPIKTAATIKEYIESVEFGT